METYTHLKEVVDAFRQAVLRILERKDHVVIAIPGGRSILGFLGEIAKSKLPFDKLHWFLIDERIVPIDHPDSNYNQAQKVLFSKVDTYAYAYRDTQDVVRGVSQYNALLNEWGGVIDIAIMGVGEDGHVASLFPEHKLLESMDTGYVSIQDSPKPPSQRITATKSLISQADTSILFFVGQAKEDAYQAFLDNSVYVTQCPAKIGLNSKNCIIARLRK